MKCRNPILPGELIEEIFSRVPATSIPKLRSTSKQWNTLLKSESFAKKHSANAPNKSLIIMLMDSRVYVVTVHVMTAHLHGNVASSRKYQLSLKDPLKISSQVDIRRLFHCNGLLLCTTHDRRLVLWNTCSGETKWIKPKVRYRYRESDIYALGYDQDHKSSYKILRVDTNTIGKYSYEIYDCTSDSWRILGVAKGWWLRTHYGGISLKGDTYWLAVDITERKVSDFLLTFDFSKESFQILDLQFPCTPHSALSVVRQEKLCILATSADNIRPDQSCHGTSS